MEIRTDKYYEQFGGQSGAYFKFMDIEIDRMEKDLERIKLGRQNNLNNFAKDNSKYVVGQWLSETVRIDDIVWSDSWGQISLSIFNSTYGIDTILESEVEEYLKHL